ncbi:prepilin peptidase [Candidatus Woesearchaeota archaeon]|nr:prepilin peptidase [Candidatus Woesearchaeota archaeon]
MLQFQHLQVAIILSFLAAAAISDLKKREVPNWVSYGFIIAGVSFALLQSAVAADWRFIAFSIAGAAAAFAIAALMFYTGQWGGGDSKLLIGLGAALGLPLGIKAPFVSFDGRLASFMFNFAFASLVYAIAFGSFLALKNRKRFKAALAMQLKAHSLLRKLLLFLAAFVLVAALVLNDPLLRLGIAAMLLAAFFGLYLSIMSKAVEHSCMLKRLSPLKLTEGDWIAKDVFVAGKRICGPKDLGVEKRQIRQLIALYKAKKISTVLVKEGIPFAPTFLLAYAITILFGNLFFAVL